METRKGPKGCSLRRWMPPAEFTATDLCLTACLLQHYLALTTVSQVKLSDGGLSHALSRGDR